MYMDVAAAMNDDSKKWDQIHQKLHKIDQDHSLFAEGCEKSFPRGSIVCDLGGGTGNDVLYFLKSGHGVILLDLSEFALKTAQHRAQEVKLVDRLVIQQVDFGLHTLPLKDASIDIAYSRIALNYFGHRHTTKIIKDIWRTLKTGGHAYLAFKSPKDGREMERLLRNAVEYEPGVYIEAGQLRSRFTVDQLKTIAGNAGIPNCQVFENEEILGMSAGGQKQILYQNVMSFTKV